MSHPLTDALPSYMDANALRQACGEIEERLTRERDEARAEVERLRGALRGLHDDIVEYQRINHLGGYDNHWMLAARAALAATESKP